MGIVLGTGIGGEDFDGMVDTGDGEEGFVGVAWEKVVSWVVVGVDGMK